jgi:hypothetical protein
MKEVVEPSFKSSLPSLDTNSLPHFQMMETAFLKPKPNPESSTFDNTPISIHPKEELKIHHQNYHSYLSVDPGRFFKPSKESERHDDSGSFTTNVTIEDIEIEPLTSLNAKETRPIEDKIKLKSKLSSLPKRRRRRVQHPDIDDDQLFDLNIKALRAFKAKYGHCRVSQEQHVHLHRWCERIRKTYGHMCSGKLESKSLSSYKAITDTQHQQLQEIGFEFFSGGRAPKSFKEKRLNSLKEFRSKFGHCKVPKRYKEDKGLGPWCCEMRHSYKLIKEGKKPRSILTMDMYEDLESLGFAWTV